MPVTIRRVKGGFRVSTPSGTKSKRTTKKKALAQKRIIEEHDRTKKKRHR